MTWEGFCKTVSVIMVMFVFLSLFEGRYTLALIDALFAVIFYQQSRIICYKNINKFKDELISRNNETRAQLGALRNRG